MTEQKVKKRAWVKNAVIIFLAIMLALTFFSNTIMNHSLPEVATSYVSSGTITAKIRGSGKVEAFETYEVKLTQTRTVETVLVKTGDIVEVGAVLFMLSGEESEELEAAINTLDSMEYEYNKSLLSLSELDFAKDDLKIKRLKEDLAEAQAELTEGIFNEEDLVAAKQDIKTYEAEIEKLNTEIKDIKRKITALGGSVDNSAQIEAIYNQIDDINEQLSGAITIASNLQASQGAFYNEFINYTKGHIMWDIAKLNANNNIYTYSDAGTDYQNTFNAWFDYLDGISGTGPLTGWPPSIDATNAASIKVIIESARDSAALIAFPSMDVNSYLASQATVIAALDPTDPVYTSIKTAFDAYNSITNANVQIALLSDERDQLQKKYHELIGKDNSEEHKKLLALQETAEDKLSTANSQLEKAKTRLSELEADEKELDTQNDAIKTLQRSLEDLLLDYDTTKEEGETAQSIAQLDLQKKREDISKQRTLVNELQSESVDSAVTAPVAGKITTINIKAGEKTGIDALMTLDLTDRGYQLSFPVTYEQAQKVTVGDMAEVSNYYWGPEITAQLINLKNDPTAPREKKLLTFSLTGEIESGSQLSLTLGGKGIDYQSIVPNSAIRTDNDGDFVLIIVPSETPLGTRYKAARVEVKVLEKDDTNSAVSGGLQNWDYVITSSNKPLEPGVFVRLAEGQR